MFIVITLLATASSIVGNSRSKKACLNYVECMRKAHHELQRCSGGTALALSLESMEKGFTEMARGREKILIVCQDSLLNEILDFDTLQVLVNDDARECFNQLPINWRMTEIVSKMLHCIASNDPSSSDIVTGLEKQKVQFRIAGIPFLKPDKITEERIYHHLNLTSYEALEQPKNKFDEKFQYVKARLARKIQNKEEMYMTSQQVAEISIERRLAILKNLLRDADESDLMLYIALIAHGDFVKLSELEAVKEMKSLTNERMIENMNKIQVFRDENRTSFTSRGEFTGNGLPQLRVAFNSTEKNSRMIYNFSSPTPKLREQNSAYIRFNNFISVQWANLVQVEALTIFQDMKNQENGTKNDTERFNEDKLTQNYCSEYANCEETVQYYEEQCNRRYANELIIHALITNARYLGTDESEILQLLMNSSASQNDVVLKSCLLAIENSVLALKQLFIVLRGVRKACIEIAVFKPLLNSEADNCSTSVPVSTLVDEYLSSIHVPSEKNRLTCLTKLAPLKAACRTTRKCCSNVEVCDNYINSSPLNQMKEKAMEQLIKRQNDCEKKVLETLIYIYAKLEP
uniref:CASPASE_P20 domain-containing protein n=1 Tax=Heterorhabditis bacteriophora TaxID=37862 RepID=A0A1I7XUQ7_HETBA